jgi:hypothetical protein
VALPSGASITERTNAWIFGYTIETHSTPSLKRHFGSRQARSKHTDGNIHRDDMDRGAFLFSFYREKARLGMRLTCDTLRYTY